MSRLIKFRAWDLLHKKMMTDQTVLIGYTGSEFWLVSGFERYVHAKSYPIRSVNNQIELMQFTGLKDKNGKEIYEGDVVRPTNPNNEPQAVFVVKWTPSGYTFEVTGYEYDLTTMGFALEEEYEFEVIGNIYENPELIGSKNRRLHEENPSQVSH